MSACSADVLYHYSYPLIQGFRLLKRSGRETKGRRVPGLIGHAECTYTAMRVLYNDARQDLLTRMYCNDFSGTQALRLSIRVLYYQVLWFFFFRMNGRRGARFSASVVFLIPSI
jgi:hypothetical protein